MMFAIVGRKRQCHNPYTDAQGSFQIGPLSPGRVEISAYLRKPLSHAAPKALHAGDSGVVLTLHAAPRRAVRGRVIDGATGQAVKARVKIVRPRTTRRSSGQLTQEDGTFQLRVFRSGANEVIAWAEPDLFGEVRGVGLRDGTATEGVLVRLRRTGKIRVTLARADLRLLRRKLLLHVELDGRRYYGLPLFERVTEVRLPPGRARVIVSLAGSNRQQPRPHPVTRVVQVTAGQTADVMLPLPPASGQ